MELQTENNFVTDVKQILELARKRAFSAINSAMVEAYWLVGKRIIDEEQKGEKRAEYGKEVLKSLAKELTSEFGKGFSLSNIRNFRQFYLTFPHLLLIRQTPSGELTEFNSHIPAELSWSHYQLIMRVSDKNAQDYYLKEASINNWSVRTLHRNINTLYYQRLLSSQWKEPLQAEMQEKTKVFQEDKYEFIKNPFVLEFLNLPANISYTEAKLASSFR